MAQRAPMQGRGRGRGTIQQVGPLGSISAVQQRLTMSAALMAHMEASNIEVQIVLGANGPVFTARRNEGSATAPAWVQISLAAADRIIKEAGAARASEVRREQYTAKAYKLQGQHADDWAGVQLPIPGAQDPDDWLMANVRSNAQRNAQWAFRPQQNAAAAAAGAQAPAA